MLEVVSSTLGCNASDAVRRLIVAWYRLNGAVDIVTQLHGKQRAPVQAGDVRAHLSAEIGEACSVAEVDKALADAAASNKLKKTAKGYEPAPKAKRAPRASGVRHGGKRDAGSDPFRSGGF